MRLQVLAVGQKMPPWVALGFREYAGRMPPEARLELVEFPAGDRGKGANVDRAREVEAQRLLGGVPRGARIIVLDPSGRQESTDKLSRRMADWFQDGRDTAFLIGGPDGLAGACLQASEHRWSLSELTLPHMLVRVVVAEQLYRAWSILANHPYHR